MRKGSKMSEEQKKKISEALKRLPPRSAEHRKNLSNAMKGKTGRKHTVETRRKISESRKGKYVGPDSPNWRGGIRKPRRRNIELIEIFTSRSLDGVIRCYFCGKEVMKLSGKSRDSLAIHSLDGNHDNWESSNKVPVHVACHGRYHSTGENSPNWHGETASDEAKWMRKYRRGNPNSYWITFVHSSRMD